MFYRLFALLALVALAPARQGDAVASPAAIAEAPAAERTRD